MSPPDVSPAEPATSGLWRDGTALLHRAWGIQPRRMALQIALLVSTGLTGGVSLLLLVPVVNAVAASSGGTAIAMPGLSAVSLSSVPLVVLLAAVVALVAAQALLVRWAAVNAVLVQQRLVDHLRITALDAILVARWSFILQSRRSDITEIATIGATRAGSAFNALLQGSVSAVIAFATAVVSGIVAPGLTAIVVVAMLVMFAALLRSLHPAHSLGRLYGSRSRALQAALTDSLDSLRLARAHGASGVWRHQLATALVQTRAAQVDHTRRSATTAAVATIAVVVCAAALVLVAVQFAVPAATIVLVLVLAARLAQAVRQLAANLQQAANALPAVADLAALTTAAQAAREAPPGPHRPLPEPDPGTPIVRLHRVWFRYPGADEGVSDLSFELRRGRITALVGPSGAGKSTTADLVLGLLSPDRGTIEVDGVRLEPGLLTAWRERVAYVPQETVLLPGTLRWNLLWSAGRADVTDAECWTALDDAAATFARDLPDGLDTPLGDRGVRLSGGQRQRLAIARALLRRPELLVLDEATSALDDLTESAVMGVVAALAPRLAILVIAHRASTIEVADQVLTLDRGRLVGRRPVG